MSKARLKLLKREVKELRRARSDQLLRDGVAVARRTVERLMAAMGLRGSARQDDDHHGQQPQGTVSIG